MYPFVLPEESEFKTNVVSAKSKFVRAKILVTWISKKLWQANGLRSKHLLQQKNKRVLQKSCFLIYFVLD